MTTIGQPANFRKPMNTVIQQQKALVYNKK